MSHSARAAQALAHLAERDPALSVLALWCAHRDGDRTETAGTQIRYGPDFVGLSLAEQIGTVGHHVLHVALRHSARQDAMAARYGGDFNPDLFGLVADALVNETLLLAEHGLPRPAVTVTGLLQEAGEPVDTAIGALSAWDAERLYLKLSADPDRAGRAKAYGDRLGWKPDLGTGDIRGGPEDEGKTDPAEWQGRLARAMQAGRQAGTGIGQIGAPLADFAPPQVPWERQLRGLITRALSVDPKPVWRRPAGRWVAMEAQARAYGRPTPVFQPQQRLLTDRPRVIVALDTSSSIDARTLRLFGAEIDGILRRSGAEARLLGFDTEVHLDIALSPAQWRSQLHRHPLRTGGGTDFGPALKEAARYDPSIAIILTDLDGPTGPAPRFPVIWATPNDPPDPGFGRILKLPNGATYD
ncbi:MAG: VWA-like domain-containing protein [Paracoccaceae bacterium]|nr:VWA-like domain-containing protein [Paracoccaceae bacterium]